MSVDTLLSHYALPLGPFCILSAQVKEKYMHVIQFYFTQYPFS